MATEQLAADLVRIKSLSGGEAEIAAFIASHLRAKGLSPKVDGRNVLCSVGKGKRSLLLNSHLDTVPPNSGWSMDPFAAKKAGGKLYGLGSNDAKGCVACMIDAFTSLDGKTLKGKVILALTCDEETGGQGLETVLPKLGKLDGAIIGEPTGLGICNAQKGHLMLKVVAKGKSAHSSYPEKGVNAIYKACEGIGVLRKMSFSRKHKALGLPTVAVTTISGGTKRNVIPSECEFIADIRSTPAYSHDELIRMVKKKLGKGMEVVVHSSRLVPKETSADEKIVKAAKAVLGTSVRGSSTMSDMVFVDCPAIKLGPGNSHMSHQADEYIEISQLKKGVAAYKSIIERFLAP